MKSSPQRRRSESASLVADLAATPPSSTLAQLENLRVKQSLPIDAQVIARHEEAEVALREMIRRAQVQMQVASEISQADALLTGDVQGLALVITERAAKTIECERVSIWMFDETQTDLTCIDLYEATPDRHSQGMVLCDREYGPEIQSLKDLRYVSSDDPLTDPRTAGYVDSYIKPLRITSLLDVGIQVSEKNFGLLRFERVDKPHDWQQDEIAFAIQLANNVAFASVSRIRREAEAALTASEAQLSNALSIARAAHWEYDAQTNLFTFNDNFYRIFGTTAEKVGGYTLSPAEYAQRFVHPDDIQGVASEVQTALQSADPHYSREIEHRIIYANGDTGFLAVRFFIVKDASGRTIKTYGVNQDITKRKQMEQESLLSHVLRTTAVQSSLDGILIVDKDAKAIWHNQNFAKMWRIPQALLDAGDDKSMLLSVIAQLKDPDGFLARVRYLYDHPNETAHDEIELKDGRFFDRDTVCLCDPEEKYLGRAWFFRDVTDRKRAEAIILKMARHDDLTDLVNRRVLVEMLEQSIGRARRYDKGFAVLCLDLDAFKDINDTLGHSIGDLLLKAVAKRLRRGMRKIDTVARLGGDEFAVILADTAEPTEVAVVAKKILTAMREPFLLEGNEIRIGTSIGIATFGSDSPDAESLLVHADIALYRAKQEGRETFQFYAQSMDRDIKARVSLGNELRAAISAEQLVLFYQPEVEIETGRILGLEALVRWNHPTRGLIGPGEFIPAAEKNGLIIALGGWVMREACRQARVWMDMQILPDFVAVNVSALQFRTPHELEKDISSALAESGLPACKLEIELTETGVMDTSRRHGDALQRLREQGIRIAIDDFGTGYSSLDYLRRFPASRIKIAQSFVMDLETNYGSGAIVRAALGLARELNLAVVAEGVETKEQLALLKSWGCREAQGYYFAKPLPVKEVTELLRKGSIHPSASQLSSVTPV